MVSLHLGSGAARCVGEPGRTRGGVAHGLARLRLLLQPSHGRRRAFWAGAWGGSGGEHGEGGEFRLREARGRSGEVVVEICTLTSRLEGGEEEDARGRILPADGHGNRLGVNGQF